MRFFNRKTLTSIKNLAYSFYKTVSAGLSTDEANKISVSEEKVVPLWHYRFFELFTLLVVLLLSVYLGYFFEIHQIVSGDQMQMIEKGYHAAQTYEFIPYGNEASTVGNVPGSLSSIIVGLPLIIYMHPLSPVVLLIFLRILGVLFFMDALRQLKLSSKVVVAGTAIYALNPWFMYDFLLYNPSYLSFGAAVFLNMLVRLRKGQELSNKRRFTYSLVLALSVGFCLQFHFSWPVLVALCGVLWLRRDIKISYLGILVGVLIVALTLIPYFIELWQNHAIRTNSAEYTQERYFGYGLVHVFPLFKAVLYWLRFGSLLVTQKALIDELPQYAPFYFEIGKYLWIVITQVIGIITVCASAIINFKVIFKLRQCEDAGIKFIRGLTISCLVALLVAAAAATLVLNYWQIIILFVFALMPIVLALCLNSKWRLRHLWVLMCIMVAFNVISAMSSDKFSIDSSYVQSVNEWCTQKYGATQCGLDNQQNQSIENVETTNPL